MTNLRNLTERLTALTLAVLMMFSCITLAESAQAAERTAADYVFTDYGYSYHLVDFLNGYNTLAFGNAHSKLHMMGAMLVQGNYTGDSSNSGFADGDNLPPSYIKGELLAANSVYNSRNHANVAPLYVGSSNAVSTWESNGTTYYSVNGLSTGNNGTTPVYVSDNFFNFAEAYDVIKADQATMLARGTVVEPVNGVITINIGDNVIIESLEGVSEINLIGDPTEDVNTTVNILDSGDVYVPRQHFNGSQPSVREQNEAGTALVFNFPNADSVKLPTQNWVGHVIAPDSDVSQDSGNFNGCIICDNLYTGAEGHIYSYNTRDTSWDTVYSLEKVWNDGNNADGLRPSSIQVQLLANGEPYGDPVTLTAEDDWYYVWPTLPEKDADGDTIVYSAREVSVPTGYTSEYDATTQTLINTHNYEEIDIHGTKTWAGESAFGSRMRPMYLTVYLYADGERIDSQTIVVTSEETQSYSFENLPKYKNGVEINYTIHEDAVAGYIGSNDGYNLINTWGVDSVDITGTKTWNDDNDRDGLRPTSVVVQLLADGEVIEEHTVTATNGWVYYFNNLPETDQYGTKITYTVREKDVPDGYTSTVDGYDIINDHDYETIDLSGKKTWADDDNNDGKRPESITVILLANQGEVARKTVTAADNWAWSFTDLPKNDGGKAIHYTVTEEAVEGYTTTTSGLDITNTHENETVEVSGSKTWVDDDDNDGVRPVSITIRLLQDGVVYQTKTVTEADGWAWSFTELPKYTDGVEHVYTIQEDAVEGYTTTVQGYDVINTHESETIDVLGHKVWNDNNNNDGVRPARLNVYLTRNGVRTGDYRTTTADRNWYWLFTDLPKYEDGVEITYGFEEDAVEGYTGPNITRMTTLPEGYGDIGYELTNTHEDETVEISGSKTWNDDDDNDGKRPESIVIRLWKTTSSAHVEVANKTVTESSNWAWDFGELPKYDNGEEIIYTVTEDTVDGYSTVINGYDVENSYTPGKISISGVKYWNDANDQDGLRPESITVRLHKTVGGVTTEVDSKVVTAADGWAGHFTDLPEYEDGEKIVYTITEDPVEGYESVIDQYDLINTHIPETVNVSGTKTWIDANNQDGMRPVSVTIRLHKTVGGVTTEIRNAVVTESNNWKWNFVNLPKYENGELITYTITEDAVEGYVGVVNGYDVVNTHETEETSVSGSKTWNDSNNQDGKRPASITIRLLANGTEIASKNVTAADGWAWSFTKLPKYENGKLITYTITEDEVDEYTSEISGYNAINAYTPETTDVNGYKIWNDSNNQDGKRPTSITINLLADGVKVASKTVTASNGWMWSFTNLPKYADGKLIVYTITEDAVTNYTSSVDGYKVTNTYETEETSVSGSKTWNDKNNQDGKRPASITINLLADGVEVAEKTVTAADNWAWSFTELPKYADGKLIVYTITEDAVTDYTTVVSGYNVTNTYETEETSVSGSKTWNDNNNQDGKRPVSITINLLADGVEVAEKTVTAADNWSWSFTELPKYADGKLIVYTITEDAVTDYTTVVSGYNVTNTYEPEETSVSGSKTWNDNNNQDGKRPTSITINLLADGVEVAEKTVTAADNWAWSFTELPKYADGKLIVYTITEDAVTDYTTVVSGYNVTNTYETEETSVSGSKTWNDNHNQDGKRPASITINLLADGVEVAEKTVTAADNWAWSFTELPKYANGKLIVYTITEDAVTDYTTVVSGYNVTNTYETEETSVSGSKTWNDNNNQDGKRPTSITINLLADGVEVAEKTVTAADNWAWSFTELPKYADGKLIVYTITEDAVTDYTTVVSGYNVTNTYETEETFVSGSKTWNDNNNQDGKRPTSITINLLADGVEVAEKTVTAADNWSWSFTELPKYADGKLIVYTITEDAVTDYTTVVSGYNVTNTYETEETSVSGSKTWNDNNNQDGKRPASITINLLADGVEVAEKTVTAADNWAWSFTELPKYADGKLIVYTITEDAVTDYTTVVSGYNVTNTYETEETSVSGSKTWNDNNNQDGKRPTSITINLLADGVEVAEKTVTAADKWAWSFTELPKYANGKLIVYTITEDAVTDYTTVVSGYNVTNTYETEETSVSGSKTWNDNNNQDGKRPTSITINLLADGVEVAEKTVTAADNWAWSFTELPKYADGKLIVYTITEDAVTDYTTVVSGYNVTNTYETEETSVSGSKTWNDNNNQDGKRPASITINLLADGVEVAEKTVTAADNWAWSFTELPKYADGKLIVYTITEDAVTDYTTVVSGYNVTNTYETEETSVSGSKTWNDNNNQDGKRPTSITINLLADGVEVAEKTVTAADNWAWSFTELPKYANGKLIVYTITEDAVTDYTTVVSGYNVTNTYETEETSVSGSKTWNDNNNQDGKRPTSITINLLADGVEVAEKTVTAADNWAWSFTELPKYADGKLIVYTITEDMVTDYTTVVSGYNVTNTYETEETSVSGSKTWNDNNNQDGKRPVSITINLLADGVEAAEKTVTAADNWSWSFTELPKYANGKLIVYTITEDAVTDYTTVVSGYNVTNTYETEETSVSGSKTWNDNNNQDGKRPASITINLLADGVEVAEKTVTAADNWSWSFTELPKYADGKLIVYTITEDMVTDYTTVVSGYNVTNTYETEETSVSGSKTWNDNNNQDGKRPTSITINLLADGVEVAEKTVTAADNWAWSFTELPKYADGKLIVYTITEDAVTDYTTVVSGYNVTNTYETEETSVSGSKTWNDNNNQDGKRPVSITINLLADGVEVAEKTVTAADNWAWSFTELPKYADGKLIVYTITEDAVSGYVTTVMGYDVINSRGTEKTAVNGRKTWVGDEDALERRPESITVYLLADGVRIDSKTVTERDGWAWSFTDLPVNQNGQPITYTIEEEPVARYTSFVDGYNVTNTYICTNFAITKRWRGVSGGTIAMTLYANGECVDPQPQLTQYGEVYVWEDLPLYDENGNEIVYYAVENPMDGYSPIYENEGVHAAERDAAYPGATIINVEMTSMSVRKVWADVASDEELPAIQLVLYCNGEVTDVEMPVPTVSGWYIYEDLPAEVNGVRAHYTVQEKPVEGFMTIYTNAEGEDAVEATNGSTITNKKIPTTGDAAPLGLWIGLLGASVAMLAVIRIRRRRHA